MYDTYISSAVAMTLLDKAKEKLSERKEKFIERKDHIKEKLHDATDHMKEAFSRSHDDGESEEESLPEPTTLYINLFVVNKEDAIQQQVEDKISGDGGSAAMNLLATVAGKVANAAITNNVVAAKMTEKLCQEMPNKLNDAGIAAEVSEQFKSGSFVVLKLMITDVDVEKLFTGMAMEKKPEMAKKVNRARRFASKFGLGAKLDDKLKSKILPAMEVKLATMLPEKLESKMKEKGMIASVSVKNDQEQGPHFFELINKLSLPGSGTYDPSWISSDVKDAIKEGLNRDNLALLKEEGGPGFLLVVVLVLAGVSPAVLLTVVAFVFVNLFFAWEKRNGAK